MAGSPQIAGIPPPSLVYQSYPRSPHKPYSIIYAILFFDMVPKILRALKAALLRRRSTPSPSCPTPSFHAGPQYPHAADTLHPTPLGFSDTRNLLLASASDAMLATAHLAEIVALFPGDDDSCYEESVPIDYTSTDISSDADSTFSHFTYEESFEEEGIFVNGMCFTSQELKATSSYYVCPIRQPTAQTPAAIQRPRSRTPLPKSHLKRGTSSPMVCVSFLKSLATASSSHHCLDFVCEPPIYSAEDTVPVVESTPVKVASGVPKRLLEILELKDDPEPGVPPPAELKSGR